MCRWLAYSGTPIPLEELLVKRDRSLIDQSLHSRLGATTTNGDGFGVGWYEPGEGPRLYRSTHPAWNDRNLRELAAGIRSPLFMAHIRASTGTAIQETNTHPFRYGNWLWMHNGLVREFTTVKRELVLDLPAPEELQAAHGQRARDLGGALARERQQRRGQRGQDHVARHAHAADVVHDGGDERTLARVVPIAQRRRRLQLDDEQPAQQPRVIVELGRLAQHLAQGRDVRHPSPQLVEREPVEAREVRQEIVVVDDRPMIARELHVDLDHARARHVRGAHGLARVLDRARRILAEVVAEAPVRDREGPQIELEEEGHGGGQGQQRRDGRLGADMEECECRDERVSKALACRHAHATTRPCKGRTGHPVSPGPTPRPRRVPYRVV